MALFFAVLMGLGSSTSAQEFTGHRFGVSLTEPVNPLPLFDNISTYKNLGISVLELQHPVPGNVLDSLAKHQIQVLIRNDHKFLTTYELMETRSQLIQKAQAMLQLYQDHSNVSGIGLMSYGQPNDNDFDVELGSILASLRDSSQFSFYEVSSVTRNSEISSVIEIGSENYTSEATYYLVNKAFRMSDFEIVQILLSSQPEIVFFDSKWFEEASSSYSALATSLSEYNTSGEFVLPLPNVENPPQLFNWPVLLFFLIWLSLGVHIKSTPTYRDTIFRYFTFHRFFVDDIMRFRERSAVSGTFLLLQHALFTGLLVYIMAKFFVSETGLDALYHHLPLLAVFGKNYFSLFSIAVVVTFLVEMIGILWLYIPSKSMQHFSQVLNLYSWVFHIDFLLISVMLVLLLSNSTSIMIPILGIAFIVNWLVGFGLCAIDSSKYLLKGRISYLFYTIGLHSIINIGILIFILTNNQILDFLSMISTL